MVMPRKPVYVIDGANFSNFAGFVEECNRAFIHAFGGGWNGMSWDAFHDYLSWTEGEYVVAWKRSDLARAALGDDLDTVLDVFADNPHVELRLE